MLGGFQPENRSDPGDPQCDYRARLSEIHSRLPPALVRLTSEVSLHDGIIEQVVWSPGQGRLRLVLVCGDLQNGYFEARLTYDEAMLGSSRIDSLRRAASDRMTELLYDEVDMDVDGVFSHRILFYPSEKVTIDFKSFDLGVSPRGDRRVRLGEAFIVEQPDE